VLNVADLLGKKPGDNPHFWYSPGYVSQVIGQITRDYQALDPQNAPYFSQQQADFENALSHYRELIASIKQEYSGVQVGATESIFVYMADAMGLNLISPPAFMNATSGGTEPSASAVAQFQQQITQRQIILLVYNLQTTNVVTTSIRQLAETSGISTAGISETIVPAGQTFQDWQVFQLENLLSALKSGG
jgi:zinc/manganese transport system substrate-binding protein